MIKRLKAYYHRFTHREINVETPLIPMTVEEIGEDYVVFSFLLNGEFKRTKILSNEKTRSGLKVGEVKQVQTYRYLIWDQYLAEKKRKTA